MQYSIVNLSELKKITNSFRIDAEYLDSNILSDERLIKAKNGKKLKDLCVKIFSGPFGSSLKSSEYLNYGVPFIRILNMENFFLNKQDLFYISKENNDRLSSSKIEKDDIIISKIGTLGIVSILTEDIGENANISENNIGIKVKDINPKFLLVFLNSNMGQKQILRFKSGNVQPKLNTSDIENIFIPILSQPFQQSIADLVNISYALRQSADTLYKEAENILLEELGLKNYQPQNKKCFVKMLSNTQEAGRIDAEYFQPKYEDVIDKIKKYKNGFLFFEDKDINDKNFNPKKDIEYKYIELANISGNSSIDGVENIIGCDLPTRARRIVKANDLIVSSIEGSLNSIALISKKLDGALCSTGFFVVNSNKINSEALLVFLKSNLGQIQLKRGCKGTILTAISKDELKNLIVPLLPQSIQSQISAKIQQSFESREKSKQLLEVAKRAVEIAIEENEEAGLKYIEDDKFSM